MGGDLPDYVTDPDAVLKDNSTWRYRRVPDYEKTRKYWAETKKYTHTAGTLPSLIENLIKNWEIEASYKTSLADWRTIDRPSYTLSLNGGPAQPAEHMLAVGTYNALIDPNEFYCPVRSGFEGSHKTFKRMMPTFAWEVVEVYAGPPKVAFRWRHWGVFRRDYEGVNSKGEQIEIKAHGDVVNIEGIAVADVNDKLQLQKVDIFYDPMALFREMRPDEKSLTVTRAATAHL